MYVTRYYGNWDPYTLSIQIQREITLRWDRRDSTPTLDRLRAQVIEAHTTPLSQYHENLYRTYRQEVVGSVRQICEAYLREEFPFRDQEIYPQATEYVTTHALFVTIPREDGRRLSQLEEMYGQRTKAKYLKRQCRYKGGPKYETMGSTVEGARGGLLQLWRKYRMASPEALLWWDADSELRGDIITYETAHSAISHQLEAERALWQATVMRALGIN